MPSSVIKRYLYDASAQELVIELVSGKSYAYEDVPRDTYEALLAAPSKGAFYNSEIRDTFYFRPLNT